MEDNQDPTPQQQYPAIYDGKVAQRFEFIVRRCGRRYETAHCFDPIDDPRYVKFLRAVNLRGSEDYYDSDTRAAAVKLWDDICTKVENVKFTDPENWKNEIDSQEKLEAIIKYLAVGIIEGELAVESEWDPSQQVEEVAITEAWFNDEACQQKHRLKAKSQELRKKFEAIARNEYKPETTRGLRRKPKMIFHPQAEAKGRLYDEMLIASEGFVSDVIPLRFKTIVIDEIFGATLDGKK